MRIEHAALYVRDLESAKDFYTEFFEARAGELYVNPSTGFRSYFLTFSDGARLEIMNRPDIFDLEKPATRTGYAHIAFSVGSKRAVDAITSHLRCAGCRIISEPRVTGDGYYESCMLDPEGNQLEFTE